MSENRKIIIEAYGILWRENRPSGFAYDARKTLLSDLTQDEKRDGINMAIKKYGPLRLDELPPEERAQIDPASFHSNQGAN